MKSRETLIRLKRFQVDEKRRQVAQIDAPTLVSFVGELDGRQVNGHTIFTDVDTVQTKVGPRRQPRIKVRFAKLGRDV